MKEMELTKGKVALVDDKDFEWLSQWKWSIFSIGYAGRTEVYKTIYMHRVIANAPKGFVIDHLNGNIRDNRRCNLRICTHAENLHNNRRKRGEHRPQLPKEIIAIRATLKEIGLTQKELAELARVSVSYLGNVLTGRQQLTDWMRGCIYTALKELT